MASPRQTGDGRWLFVGLIGLVVWAPFPLGSNREWAWSILEIAAFSLALGWLWQFLHGRVQVGQSARAAAPSLILFAVWLAWVALQLVPLPFSLVEMLSPHSATIHAGVDPTRTPDFVPLSIDVHATLVFWLKSAAYACSFALALALIQDRGRLRALATAIVASAVIQSAYASFMLLSGAENGLFGLQMNTGVAHGAFVNRNHLAGYTEMGLALGVGLLIADLNTRARSGLRQRLRGLLALLLSPKTPLRILIAVMVVTLVLTRSRMGNIAFLASLVVAGLIALASARGLRKSLLLLLSSLVLLDTLILGAWFGIDQVGERIANTAFGQEYRDEVYVYALRYWGDYWWTGSGGGSFYGGFPHYRELDVRAFYDYAHNDYLQFAAETGMVGIALLGAIVGLSLGAAVLAQYRRRDPLMKGIACGSLMGIVALLIHSMVDFNLQIPANAMTFVLLLALASHSLHLQRASENR